ncbi:DedA family protein [Citricoccus sp.]|uniref:DedA family protein n=1 Tax=Citricoccus sp. TaxID=1978372 RepID=UPI0028BE5A0F|nr:DedA family protein [Citricoccus sp.]
MIEEMVLHAAGQWWILLAVYLLCTIDGFFPVVPSESVLVALASISGTEDTVSLWWVWLVGALGAITGDQIAYALGRGIGITRFRWMRSRSVVRAVATARTALDGHGALVICTARYIPGGRVAVNYTAGATGYPRLRFTLLDIFAAFLWSGYSIGIARATAGWLDNTLLQIIVALVAAAAVGWVLDLLLKRILRRLAERKEAAGEGRRAEAATVDSPRD